MHIDTIYFNIKFLIFRVLLMNLKLSMMLVFFIIYILVFLQLDERIAAADWSKQGTNQTRHSYLHVSFDHDKNMNFLLNFGQYQTLVL